MEWWGLFRHLTNLILLQVFFSTPVLGSYMLKRPTVQMKDVIPEGYDSFQTPDVNGEPVDVNVGIVILNIRKVDVKSMSFVADIFLHEVWKDPRLRFPANGTFQRISLNPMWEKHIWTPDVYFQNALEGKVLDTIIPYVYLYLHNDSTVDFGARLALEFSCDMLLNKFPHDTQTCDVIMKSLTHTPDEMNLSWDFKDGIFIADDIFLPQFELGTPSRSTCYGTSAQQSHREGFACIRALIHFTRRSGYYFINVYIPSMLIVFMSMLTFWIPVEAVPGRVTLGVTSLLTIITKQYQTALPNVSYVVALNIWMSVCITFVFFSLLEYSAVLALLSYQKRLVAQSMNTSPKDDNHGDKDTERRPNSFTIMFNKYLQSTDVYNIDRVCRIIFPLVFCTLCLAYFIVYIFVNRPEI